MKFTVETIAALQLPAGVKDRVFWDDDVAGFGIRLREGGSRNWIYRYRVGSKQRNLKLGSAKSVPLAKARNTASDLEAKVRLGADPQLQRQTARVEADQTFKVLAEQYLQSKQSKWRKKTHKENTRRLMTYAKPLHQLPITAITQRTIANLLNTLTQERGEVTANRVRASLSATFGWVLKEGIRLPEGNIVVHTNQHEESSRDRVLSDAELKAIWCACKDNIFGAITKLLMLTGQRKSEIGSLQWDEIHDEQIVLPASRTKNRRLHIVPLSEPAKAILSQFQRRNGRTHVFGRSDNGYGGWAFSKRELDETMAKNGTPVADWVQHDFRRTMATKMAEELGIAPHIIEAVINHISGHKSGVAGIYNRATYDREKREALNLWAEHLMAIVEGRKAKVLPLKRGA